MDQLFLFCELLFSFERMRLSRSVRARQKKPGEEGIGGELDGWIDGGFAEQ